MENLKCEQRIDRVLKGRLTDLDKLLRTKSCADIGKLDEYALCFDYVEAFTFDDQPDAYLRYQISWGGPSDEFRFYVRDDASCYRIEYWFLDWFDGAYRDVTNDFVVLRLWYWLCASHKVESVMPFLMRLSKAAR